MPFRGFGGSKGGGYTDFTSQRDKIVGLRSSVCRPIRAAGSNLPIGGYGLPPAIR
jgi:hypothetical protein